MRDYLDLYNQSDLRPPDGTFWSRLLTIRSQCNEGLAKVFPSPYSCASLVSWRRSVSGTRPMPVCLAVCAPPVDMLDSAESKRHHGPERAFSRSRGSQSLRRSLPVLTGRAQVRNKLTRTEAAP